MKLLILTQKIDKEDPILGFFHNWVLEFAKSVDKVSVICLEKGRYDLPDNVKVHSLGKEAGRSKIKYVKNFFNLIIGLNREYDAVFVHMNPIYLVLGGFFWRISKKRVGLWYSHRNVDLKLRMGSLFADHIFTVAPEGFNLKRNNIHIMGHGIDLNLFKNAPRLSNNDELKILHVGRITPIKNIDMLIKTVPLLQNKIAPKKIRVMLVGEPVTEQDKEYILKIKNLVSELNIKDNVSFLGSISQGKMPQIYTSANLSVNLAPKGGFDKSVIESISVGTPAIVCNTTFGDFFGTYASRFIFRENDIDDLVNKLVGLLSLDNIGAIIKNLQTKIHNNFNAQTTIKNIVHILKN